MGKVSFEKTVKRNLSRSFRLTVITLFVVGMICAVNGLMLVIFQKGFSMGLFDTATAGIVYILLWLFMMFGAATIRKNGYKRGYALFLANVDAIGKREDVLKRVNAMPEYPLAARGAVLRFDAWGLAFAYRETFALLPCDKLVKTRIVAKVRQDGDKQKTLATELAVEFRDDDEFRVPLKDREEGFALTAALEKAFPRLNH